MTGLFYGQGMVRPGAWSVDGKMLHAPVESLHCPTSEFWSWEAIEARALELQFTFMNTSTQVQMSPAFSTSVEMRSTHGAFWTAYARTPIGFVDHHDD